MTSCDVISVFCTYKTAAKNADVIKNLVRLEFLLEEQHKGFHLRDQPTLYDKNLISYRIFRRGPEKN